MIFPSRSDQRFSCHALCAASEQAPYARWLAAHVQAQTFDVNLTSRAIGDDESSTLKPVFPSVMLAARFWKAGVGAVRQADPSSSHEVTL